MPPTLTGAHAIQPGKPYPAAYVADLFGVSLGTVRRWAGRGWLKPCPRVNITHPLRFLGVEILVRLGMSGQAAPTETTAQRAARVTAARGRMRLAVG